MASLPPTHGRSACLSLNAFLIADGTTRCANTSFCRRSSHASRRRNTSSLTAFRATSGGALARRSLRLFLSRTSLPLQTIGVSHLKLQNYATARATKGTSFDGDAVPCRTLIHS